METGRPVECDTYRVIILRPMGTAVLVVAADGGFVLPAVEVPRRQRIAESLTTAMRRQWKQDAISLFALPAASRSNHCRGCHYQVMEHCGKAEERNGRGQWVEITRLSRDNFADPQDGAMVRQSIARWRAYAHGRAPGPFARPGWFGELRRWVKEVIEPLGLTLTSDFCQLNASPSFSLIRLGTNGPAVWFKAVGEPNLREFSLTVTLAQVFPDSTARLLATRQQWKAWLMLHCDGTHLDNTQDTEKWKAACSSLAQLQIASLGRESQLLNAGARDLRTAQLSIKLHPFFDAAARSMEQQKKTPPPVLSGQQLLALKKHVQDGLSSLAELGVADTLGHLDLNPGNVIVSPAGCRFLDWAEGYVGHPFFSFEYLREHFRRQMGADPVREAQLVAAYAQPWRTRLSAKAVANTFAVVPMLAVLAYAAGSGLWSAPEKTQSANAAVYLRSLTRRMQREAKQWLDGRTRWQG